MADAKNKFDYTKLNTLAVVSLASAISLFGAPAAVLSGHISLAQLKESKEKGRWMAITGLVLGYVGIALAVIFTIVNLVLKARHGMGIDDDNMFHSRIARFSNNNLQNRFGYAISVHQALERECFLGG
jgi:hypothetical protein